MKALLPAKFGPSSVFIHKDDAQKTWLPDLYFFMKIESLMDSDNNVDSVLTLIDEAGYIHICEPRNYLYWGEWIDDQIIRFNQFEFIGDKK